MTLIGGLDLLLMDMLIWIVHLMMANQATFVDVGEKQHHDRNRYQKDALLKST